AGRSRHDLDLDVGGLTSQGCDLGRLTAPRAQRVEEPDGDRSRGPEATVVRHVDRDVDAQCRLFMTHRDQSLAYQLVRYRCPLRCRFPRQHRNDLVMTGLTGADGHSDPKVDGGTHRCATEPAGVLLDVGQAASERQAQRREDTGQARSSGAVSVLAATAMTFAT